jgi:hypothetical protein
MMPSDAAEYVSRYLRLQVWFDKQSTTTIQVKNYLQSGLGTQSANAKIAYQKLLAALPKLLGKQPGNVFEVDGEKYLLTSLWRVYNGKGAPNEIQDALYLAMLCGSVDGGKLQTYADSSLGIDCGGFVANYWGMGRPSESDLNPDGATGFKPRTIWGKFPKLQRKAASEIDVDDAAVFFKDVKNDDPNIAAQPNAAGGGYDSSTGSQAFHIGVVQSVSAIAGTDQVDLTIAESSGAPASSGGNGVNVRQLGKVKATVAKGLVWCPDGNNRIYFVGKDGGVSSYLPAFLPAKEAVAI